MLYFSFIEIMTLYLSTNLIFFVYEIDIYCVQVCSISREELIFLRGGEYVQYTDL
jgi:hypothetical protein